jgi:hypothetical protein
VFRKHPPGTIINTGAGLQHVKNESRDAMTSFGGKEALPACGIHGGGGGGGGGAASICPGSWE